MPTLVVLLLLTAPAHPRHADGTATGGAPASAAEVQNASGLPSLRIDAAQQEAVRAAAAPYRGSSIRIVVHRPTAQYRAFARGLGAALEAAGLTVATTALEEYDQPDCPDRPGLRIMYGIARSGAVNAIAEALIRSRIVTESIAGCSVVREDEFTFIIAGAAS